MTTHCQICGRAIKSKSGLIAHHGYQRPHAEYQTRSCFGARWRPYEVACDALPVAIANLTAFLTQTEAALKETTENPPRGITVTPQRRYGYWTEESSYSVLKPADFKVGEQDYIPKSYRTLHANQVANLQQTIKGVSEDIVALKARLANWKPNGGTK